MEWQKGKAEREHSSVRGWRRQTPEFVRMFASQKFFAGIGGSLLDGLLPPRCLACTSATDRPDCLCADCWGGLSFITKPFCAVYGTPFSHDLGEGAVSARAISDPPVFGRVRAPLAYRGPARNLVTALKFGGRRELAAPMARLMERSAAELIVPDSLIVPVPLHPWRRLQRRFNQSADLARHLSRLSGGLYDPLCLKRTRATRQQVGLEAAARHTNVRNAFVVEPEKALLLRERPVVLVDDVLTTGATVTACTKALLRAGAGSVDVLVFAMALQGDQPDTPGA